MGKIKPYKPTRRELDETVNDLQKQIFELDSRLAVLTEHLGVYISQGPTIVKVGQPR